MKGFSGGLHRAAVVAPSPTKRVPINPVHQSNGANMAGDVSPIK
jgi:hypothetical protein